MMAEIKWYDVDATDNPPWIKALAEVRRLAPREGWCYQHCGGAASNDAAPARPLDLLAGRSCRPRRDRKQPHHGGALSHGGPTVGHGPDFLPASASRVALFGQAGKAITVQ
jgi:hypothetical protein